MIEWHCPFRPGGVAVRVRSASVQTATVVVAGQSQALPLDPNVSDGNGVVYVDGLAGDVAVSVTIGEETETSIVRAMPASGPFSVVFATCWDRRGHFVWGDQLLNRQAIEGRRVPDLFWCGGDFGYAEFRYTAFDEAYIPANLVPYADQLGQARKSFRQVMRDPRIRRTFQRIPFLNMRDDHESPGNNRDGTAVSLNEANMDSTEPPDGVITADPTEVAQVFAWWDQAFGEVFRDEVWCESGTYYGAFRQGNTLFLATDCVTQRDALTKAQTSAKYMLSATQEAWFAATLAAHTDAGFVVWLNPKELFRDHFGNDGWIQYLHQRRRMVSLLNAHPACVIVCTGDVHYPCITESSTGEIVEIKCSPMSNNGLYTGDGYETVLTPAVAEDGYRAIWRPQGYQGYLSNRNTNIGVLDFDGDQCEASIYLMSGAVQRVVFRAGVKGIYRAPTRIG